MPLSASLAYDLRKGNRAQSLPMTFPRACLGRAPQLQAQVSAHTSRPALSYQQFFPSERGFCGSRAAQGNLGGLPGGEGSGVVKQGRAGRVAGMV